MEMEKEFEKWTRMILLIIDFDNVLWEDMLRAGLQFVQNQNNRASKYCNVASRKLLVINRYNRKNKGGSHGV